MDDSALLEIATPLVAADEGCRLEAYRDTLGIWTIGYGHAHVEPGLCWTKAKAEAQLRADLRDAMAQLDRLLPWWRTLSNPRRCVLLNMTFQLGIKGLLGFGHALEAIRTRDYVRASALLLESRWAKEVPKRARRLARILSSGHLPAE